MALRRLKKDGLARVQADGRVALSAAGRRIARKLTLRHHLIERMLAAMFGMELWEVHDEAKLLARLGRGGACPHGNLSEVESPASRRRRGLLLLAEADSGRSYLVSGIYERDRHLLEFLEARGIRPGAKLSLIERNYDKTLSIKTGARTVVLGRPAADKVWVSPLSSHS